MRKIQSKRGNGQGGAPRLIAAKNLYEARATINGKRKSFYGKTSKEAADKALQAQAQAARGEQAFDSRQTVAQFLDQWLPASAHRGSGLTPATMVRYEELIRKHIVPALGSRPLPKLTPQHIDTLYSELLTRKHLAPATVRQVHAVLRKALQHAVYPLQLIAFNPCMHVSAPTPRKGARTAPSAEERTTLLKGISGHKHEALILFALMTGARIGEILALRWSDLDLDAGTALIARNVRYVSKQGVLTNDTKTHRSRTVPLAGSVVEALRRHRVQQATARLRAPVWQDGALVFTTGHGSTLLHRDWNERWTRTLKALGLPHYTFHAFTRHGFATTALDAGVPMTLVSRTLGHSSIGITADTYTHTDVDSLRSGVERVAAAGGA